MSPFDFGEKYINLPKVGENPITIEIATIVKVEEPGHKFNFKSREKDDYGFHYLITCKDGKSFRCGIWKLFFAFRDAHITDGDTVEIGHPSTGNWTAERIVEETAIAPDLQKILDKTKGTIVNRNKALGKEDTNDQWPE